MARRWMASFFILRYVARTAFGSGTTYVYVNNQHDARINNNRSPITERAKQELSLAVEPHPTVEKKTQPNADITVTDCGLAKGT